MRFLHERYRAAGRPSRGLDLLAAVDRWLGAPVCAAEARRHLDAASFPDLRDLYARLGVRVEGGRVRLDEDAPEAGLRRAIVRAGGR
jgi:hypothetical protein